MDEVEIFLHIIEVNDEFCGNVEILYTVRILRIS